MKTSDHSTNHLELLSKEIDDFNEYEPNEYYLKVEEKGSLFLCASIHDHIWALPLEILSKVAPMRIIHSIPHCRNIEGLTSIDGLLIPVVDLGSILMRQHLDTHHSKSLVVFNFDGGQIAALVENVMGIVSINEHSILPFPDCSWSSHPIAPIGYTKVPSEMQVKYSPKSDQILVTESVLLYERLSDSLLG